MHHGADDGGAPKRSARLLRRRPPAGRRSAELLKAPARFAVLDWEGVGDASGEPAPLTPEGIDALMDLWPIASAFESAHLGPALLLDAEKNG